MNNAKPNEKDLVMSAKEYVDCVTKRGRSIRAAARMLGVSVRQSQRFSVGDQPVSKPVRKLLRAADEKNISADELERM